MSDPIADAAKRAVDNMRRRMDDELIDAMSGGTFSVDQSPQEPLTLKKLATDMARATFDADVHITEFEPQPDKDGKVAGAYVIDNTMLPGWDVKVSICAARGQPAPKAKTIVFPSVENAMAAVSLAMKRDQ